MPGQEPVAVAPFQTPSPPLYAYIAISDKNIKAFLPPSLPRHPKKGQNIEYRAVKTGNFFSFCML